MGKFDWKNKSADAAKSAFSSKNIGDSLGNIGGAAMEIANSAMQNAKLADTTDIENATADQANEQFLANTNDDLMSLALNRRNLGRVSYSDVRGSTGGEQAMNTINGVISGASAGASVGGPWGAVAGAAIGLGSGLAGIFTGNAKAKKLQTKLNNQIDNANALNLASFNNSVTNVDNSMDNSMLAAYAACGGKLNKKYAQGGNMHTNGSIFSNGLSWINNGGTHEQNPLEGVPMGIAPDGMPNLVEQNEVVYKDFVFSNRIKVPKNLRDKYKLKDDTTFAEAAKKLSRESEERPNDPISMKTLDGFMGELAESQETIKSEREARKARKQLNQMSDEDILALTQQQQMQEQAAQEQQMQQEQMTQQQMSPEEQMMMQQQAMQQPVMAAYGGRLFKCGGHKFVKGGDTELVAPTMPNPTDFGGFGTQAFTAAYTQYKEEAAEYQRKLKEQQKTERQEKRIERQKQNEEEFGSIIPKLSNTPDMRTIGMQNMQRSREGYNRVRNGEPFYSTVPTYLTDPNRSDNGWWYGIPYPNHTTPDSLSEQSNSTSENSDEHTSILNTEEESTPKKGTPKGTKQERNNYTPEKTPEEILEDIQNTPYVPFSGTLSDGSTKNVPRFNVGKGANLQTDNLIDVIDVINPYTKKLWYGTTLPEYLQTDNLLKQTEAAAQKWNKSAQAKQLRAASIREEIDNTDNNRLNTFSRYAPIVHSAIGTLGSLFQKPDYTNPNIIRRASQIQPQRVAFNPVSDYMTYRPLDRNYYSNQARSANAATQRAIMDQSGGNAAAARAALVGTDYNFINGLGALNRQAEEYNLDQRGKVIAHNAGINQYNSTGAYQASAANAGNALNAAQLRLNGATQEAKMREDIENTVAGVRSTNMGSLFENLGNLGNDNLTRNQLQMLIDTGVLGTILNPMTEGTGAISGNASKTSNTNTKKCGGKLNKKKRKGLTY